MRAAAVEPNDDLGTVLIVDDERGPRESLQLILKPYFRVLTASGGEEALEILQREAVDVVTLDLKMPGLTGPQTLARIHELDPGLEVIVITGYGCFDGALEVLQRRAFDYIGKPFESDRILDIVRRAAELHRRRRSGPAIEILIPPLNEIVEDVERWQRNMGARLADLDRAILDRVLQRLQALRTRIRDRFGVGGDS